MNLRIRRKAHCLLVGIGLSLSAVCHAQTVFPAGDDDHVVVLPKPLRLAGESEVLPVSAPYVEGAMVMGLPAPGPDGPCPLYFRDRPHGCKKEKRATMLQNRIGEPEWYRYYRCQHFGYHPTIWTPWPENWLMCRPAPGKHPYDTAGSDPKLLKADAEREQQRLERGPLNSTQPPPLRPQEVDAPQPLPRDQ